MENNILCKFTDFIIAYLLKGKSIVFIEVNEDQEIINYNDALLPYVEEKPVFDKIMLSYYFATNKISDVEFGNLTCEEVEIYPRNQTNIILKGYRIKKDDTYLYIVENERIIDEKLFEQMDQINLELSNLTREINKKNLKLTQKNKIITEMMYEDTLTKLNNRRYLYEHFQSLKDGYLSKEIKQVSLVIADIDFFKMINDRFGHDVGDEVLIKFSDLIRKYTREMDLKIRFGGDEFIIVFYDMDMETIKNRLDLFMAEFKLIDIRGIKHKFTASFGLVEYIMDESFESFLKRADEALYEAKARGRDTLILGR